MALKKLATTSPGQRHQIRVNRNWSVLQGENLSHAKKGDKVRSLLKGLCKQSGRNNAGRITVRGKGGGNFHLYRIIDWKRSILNTPGIVQRIEYDPNRSAFIALVVYPSKNTITYVLAQTHLKVGQTILSGIDVPHTIGNSLPLAQINPGTQICLIETNLQQGAKLCRSAGTFATLIRKDDDGYGLIQLNSGIYKKVLLKCYATIGQISNTDHKNEFLGKAGVSRWKNIRPIVRGVAKNPVDHPHGGGQGKTSGGRPSVTPYGRLTKGFKTRTKPFNKFHQLYS